MEKEKQDEIIEQVLNGFDFERTLKVMNLLEWKWAYETGLTTPSVDDLAKHCRFLLEEILKDYDGKSGYTASGGGFLAAVTTYGEVRLSFVAISNNTAVPGSDFDMVNNI